MSYTTILSAEEMQRTLERLACEVLEHHGDCSELIVVGIQRRGADLAARLHSSLVRKLGLDIAVGALDINLYRDDWTTLETQPMINKTELPADIDGKRILLVDDVLFSGRTVRAGLEAILDFGRPQKVELLVLVDRGHRELPIQADYVGKQMITGQNEHIDVLVTEYDGLDEVRLIKQ